MKTFRPFGRFRAHLLCALAAVLSPGLATAEVVLFDFNSLPANINTRGGPDAIETYMEDVYGSNITVRVGARTRRGRVDGEPVGLFLGNSDEGVPHAPPADTFLINRWNATSLAQNRRDRITIVFEEHPITGLEFDWEIFPVSRDHRAGITVKADGETIFLRKLFGASRELGSLGHFSLLDLGRPVRKLEFIDRSLDAPIGIDNLRIYTNPEPSSLVIAATGVVGVLVLRRRRAA